MTAPGGMEVAVMQRFASKIRHDLRGPLINVKMGLEVLDVSDEQAPLRDSMVQQLEKAERLVANLVELAAVGAPRAEQRRLAPVLSQLAGEEELEVQVDAELKARFDPDQLLTVLRHLVANSRAAGAKDIRLSCFLEAETAVVAVEDSGPGFESLDAISAGFGLAIANASMKALGGRVECGRSSELSGASVRLEFPCPIP